jgi:hypothetical protein
MEHIQENTDEQVMPHKKATEDINTWLDGKKITPTEREAKKDDIERIVARIMDGTVTIDSSTRVITHKLLFPLERVTEIKYQPRLDGATLNPLLKHVDMNMSMYSAYGAALTGQPLGVINKLDSEDLKVVKAISGFFM